MTMKKLRITPNQKWDVYGPIDEVSIPPARKRLRDFKHRPQHKIILPDSDGQPTVWSNDPRVVNLKVRLEEQLTSSFPITIDDDGYADQSAITSDFSPLLTDAIPMTPAMFPTPDNSAVREANGLVDGWLCLEHEAIFNELLECLMSKWKPGNLRVAKFSSSGFPAHTSSAQAKKEVVLESMLPNLDAIIENHVSGDIKANLRYGFLPVYKCGPRDQTERWIGEGKKRKPKERLVPSLEYALSNGEDGTMLSADRISPTDSRLALARRRTVYGMAHPPNALLACVFDGYNQGLFENYPETFKMGDLVDLQKRIEKWAFHAAVDVSNHDTMVPKWIVEPIFDRLERDWDPKLVQIFRDMFQAPVYAPHPNVYQEDAEPMWIGNPLNKQDYNSWWGLPSGIFLVSFIGKLGCMAVYLSKLHDMGFTVLGNVDSILRHRSPEIGAFLDNGDDAIFMSNDKSTIETFKSKLDGGPYYKLGPEPNEFSGFIFYRDPKYGVRIAPNIASYLTNLLCNERGLDSRFRPVWALGFELRQEYYCLAPTYPKVKEIWDREFRNIMGYDFETAYRRSSTYENTLSRAVMNTPDLKVLEDPTKLHYRFSENEVSDEIVAMYQETLYLEEYMPYIEKYRR